METRQKRYFLKKLEDALEEVRPWCDPDDPDSPPEGRVPSRFQAQLFTWIQAYDSVRAIAFLDACVAAESKGYEELWDFLEFLTGTVISELELADESSFEAPQLKAAVGTSLPDSIHPRISEVAETLFRDGHHAEAVAAAAKMLVKLVRERSGKSDLDGTGLMDVVFSPKNAVLAFNDRTTLSEKDEQEGMYFLYKGAVLGVRNPRAHDFLEDSPERALEYIGLISLLANRLAESKTKTERDLDDASCQS